MLLSNPSRTTESFVSKVQHKSQYEHEVEDTEKKHAPRLVSLLKHH